MLGEEAEAPIPGVPRGERMMGTEHPKALLKVGRRGRLSPPTPTMGDGNGESPWALPHPWPRTLGYEWRGATLPKARWQGGRAGSGERAAARPPELTSLARGDRDRGRRHPAPGAQTVGGGGHPALAPMALGSGCSPGPAGC